MRGRIPLKKKWTAITCRKKTGITNYQEGELMYVAKDLAFHDRRNSRDLQGRHDNFSIPLVGSVLASLPSSQPLAPSSSLLY